MRRPLKVCYMCLRRTGPLFHVRRWLHPAPMAYPATIGLLSAPYNRCLGCARKVRITTYWACGLPCHDKGDRHRRHRWRWSMRLCQWLNGPDGRGVDRL